MQALVWATRWDAGMGSAMALVALLLSCLALYWVVEEPARRWARSLALRWERAVLARMGLHVEPKDRFRP